MAKLPLGTGLHRIIVIAFLMAIPTVSVAQHTMQDHGAPADNALPSSQYQILAQAAPPPGMTMTGGGDMHAPLVVTLRSGIAGGRMVYIGVGGDIDEQINPTIQVHEGETVQINLINGEGAEHDIVLDQYAARSGRVLAKGASTSLVFSADKTGEFVYF